MFTGKDSIIINDVSMGQYLTEVEYDYNKLWAPDSGRNLAGEQSGTLVGIFPKIILHFRNLTKDELEIIVPILDSARQTTTYYDPKKKQVTTITTYTGDYKIINKKIIEAQKRNEGFTCSFIATRKRV